MKRAIFIDRDGTILREPEDEQIDSLEKVEFVEGAIGALRSLMGRGFELVLVSNQDGLGTESFPEETFWPAHRLMQRTLEGEGIRFDRELIDRTFPHENAPTRKPGTGMLTDYMTGEYDLENSFVVGDRETDLQLARNLGCRGLQIGPMTWEEVTREILDSQRTGIVERKTKETDIFVKVTLDGKGASDIETGLNFFNHMLEQIPHHSGISLTLKCAGDLKVDEHHTMEDCAIALGEAITLALGDKRGFERYGFVLPMDECDAFVDLDLGGRIDFQWDVPFTREYVGDTPTEMYKHFFQSLASAMHANLHIKARGENNHHLIEGVFKAFARALRMAVRRDPANCNLPSSKGTL